jgi:ubiquinone/menaquinone biosynthesis C-methylase UbiE
MRKKTPNKPLGAQKNREMETAKNIEWSRFWEERGKSHPADDPIALDGWDYGISMMGAEEADMLRKQVANELSLTPESRFLEVGCGAGMFLLPLSETVGSAVGCDLAESMLKRARRINDKLEMQVAEASRLPYRSNTFDAILVYSVYHYFPSYEYATHVLGELYRVCRDRGRIWIGDVPEKTKKEKALLHRKQAMKQSVPKWSWPDVGELKHRFYDDAYFAEFCESMGCKYRIVPHSVEGYVQGKYRFNVYIEK